MFCQTQCRCHSLTYLFSRTVQHSWVAETLSTNRITARMYMLSMQPECPVRHCVIVRWRSSPRGAGQDFEIWSWFPRIWTSRNCLSKSRCRSMTSFFSPKVGALGCKNFQNSSSSPSIRFYILMFSQKRQTYFQRNNTTIFTILYSGISSYSMTQFVV